MNYMEQIAEILGVKLYEDFRIKAINEMIFEKKYFLTEYGLFSEDSTVPISTILNDILNGQYKIVKLPQSILTKEEREYLSMVIKPFKDDIRFIHKYTCFNDTKEYLFGSTKDYSHLEFPSFERGTMYRGMELCKEYTLEELGL